jgi:2-iminobutanoate/2-iminopropanoate deaminase
LSNSNYLAIRWVFCTLIAAIVAGCASGGGGPGPASDALSTQLRKETFPNSPQGTLGGVEGERLKKYQEEQEAAKKAASTQQQQAAAAPGGGITATAAAGEYTQATRTGNIVFLSGQIGLDPRSGAMVSETIDGQTRQAMENLRSALERNGMTTANLVSVTVYLSSISNLAGADRVYETYFRGNMPARSVVEVTGLPRGALIEISGVASR